MNYQEVFSNFVQYTPITYSETVGRWVPVLGTYYTDVRWEYKSPHDWGLFANRWNDEEQVVLQYCRWVAEDPNWIKPKRSK